MTPRDWTEHTARELAAALGPDAVDARHGRLLPHDLETTRRAAQLLHERGMAWRPVGRANDLGEGLHLSTERLDGIIEFWREDLVARIGAGCSLRMAQRRLSTAGLRVPASSPHPDHDTLGLLFATGERGWRSGPNRGLRESVLGLTAIDGSGRILKGGGRVVKNVAGYDLVRLHHGAGGAFGVVCDLTIKLEALPEHARELAVPCAASEVEARLAACRAPVLELDPAAQLWCDPGSTPILGLAPEGALLLQAESWTETVEDWESEISESRASLSIEDALSRLSAAAAWRGRWQLGARPILEDGAPLLARWRERGLGIWMVVDLLAGGATVYAEEAREGLAEALGELLEIGGRLHPAPGRPVPGGMRRGNSSAAVLRLKESFDPRALLPAPPSPLESGS